MLPRSCFRKSLSVTVLAKLSTVSQQAWRRIALVPEVLPVSHSRRLGVGISVGYGVMPRYRWVSRQKDIYLRDNPRGCFSLAKPELDLEIPVCRELVRQLGRPRVQVVRVFMISLWLHESLRFNVGCDVFPQRMRS